MSIRFISKTIHGYPEYPVAVGLIAFPFFSGLGAENPIALWLSVATGVAAFGLTVLTDHHLGLFRVLPYSMHLTVDGLVGVTFVAAPLLFGFTGIDFWFYALLGATALLVVGLHQPEGSAINA